MNSTSEPVICRPWSRDDLMRRLVTFKSSTWFGKPKVVNAVNCARRGWVNVGIDTIVCESCGARLFFSTPASWPLNQVEKAALVFSLKLDSGHKLLCLWTENICDEVLAQFSPVLRPVLVDGYRERAIKLSRLSALPVISTSAVGYLRCPELDQVITKHVTEESGKTLQRSLGTNICGIEEGRDVRFLYYEALILISLCGWGIRHLSYAVGCENEENESKGSSILDICPTKEDPNSKEFTNFTGIQYDPNFVVLCCDLCGASILSQVFYMVPHPPELLKLVGCSETSGGQTFINFEADNGEIHQTYPLNRIEPIDGNEAAVNAVASNGGLSKSGLTIAGGLPPSEHNFKAKISVPLICRNLGLQFLSGSKSILGIDGSINQIGSDGSFICVNAPRQEAGTIVESGSKKDKLSEEKDEVLINSTIHKSCIPSISNQCDVDKFKSIPLVSAPDDAVKPLTVPAKESNKISSVIVNHPNSSDTGFVETGNMDSQEEGIRHPDLNYSFRTWLTSTNVKDVKDLLSGKKMKFDPVKQHKYFCPWIAETGGVEPGWKQTLSALNMPEFSTPLSTCSNNKHSIIQYDVGYLFQKNVGRELSNSLLSNLIVKAAKIYTIDDPVTSIRNLFCSPTKRRKS